MLPPEDQSKERLINDLVKLQKRIDELEKIEEEKKKYESELAQTRAMYNGLFEFAPDAIVIVNSQGLVVQANKQAESLFGYNRDELLDTDHDLLLVPERFREKHGKNQKAFISAPHIRHMGTGLELYGRRKDGSEFPVDIALGPMQMKDDIVTLAVVRDFTERKRAMEALRISEERLRYAAIAADVGTWHWDLVKNELIWNDKCKELFGYPADYHMTYKAFLQPIHEEDRKRVDAAVHAALRDKTDYFVEMRVPLPDGHERWVMSKGRGFYDENGIPVRMHGIAMEITERKNSEQQIRELNEKLNDQVSQMEIVNKELEAFSYSVSHDLRAPLRHMAGFAERLQNRLMADSDETTQQYLALIIEASKKMDELIHDLLSFSYIGHIKMQKRKLSLNVLFKGLVQESKKEIKDRKIHWEIDELPEVIGDRSLLRLALVNLLSNAIKFTSTRSQAEIRIRCKDDGDHFTCSIADNGVGFDMKYADRLFGVFQRLHTQKEFEGTGIGLANVQRIIARHGGRIWAESAAGQGATFYFTLPKKS